jgi:LacI family transcriptional regulator, gluconate utilization system Gnt-I transcriptional repressor
MAELSSTGTHPVLSNLRSSPMPTAPPQRKRSAGPETVRMEDVAREAGVAPITVSRALNTPEKLSAATLRAVRAAIERLRYVPNLTAGSLASNRSRTVAVIVPTISNSIFSDTIDGLAQALAPHRYQLLLGQTQYRLAEEAALVQAFLGRRVDGLVLTGVNHARGVRSSLQRAGIPVVETWDLSDRPIHMLVGFSNQGAGRAAARYLLGKGYLSLGFIGGDDERSTARLRGFREAALAAGAGEVATARVPAPSTPADAGRALSGLLASGAPRAVFCSNDMLAAGALFECARRRIGVPGQLAIMGFADLPIAASIEPALTSMQVRATEMGLRAGKMLLSHLRDETPGERIVDLGYTVVERASA